MTAPSALGIVITAPETAVLAPIKFDFSPPADHEVLGRTRMSLISAGTELSFAYCGATFPVTPGYAAVFEIESVGKKVIDLAPGDLALTMGPHSSYQRAAVKDVVKVPAGVAPEHAVFARIMAVSMSTLVTTTVRPAEVVVVTGLGLVGHFAAAIFHTCGYRVIGVDPVAWRRALATRAGIARTMESLDTADDLMGHVGLVAECSGHEAAALAGCKLVRRRGEVVLLGVPWRPRSALSAHELLHAVFHQYAVLRSGWEWEVPQYPDPLRPASIMDNLATAMRWIADGRIAVNELFQLVRPGDAQAVYQDLLHSRSDRLASIFDWRGEIRPSST